MALNQDFTGFEPGKESDDMKTKTCSEGMKGKAECSSMGSGFDFCEEFEDFVGKFSDTHTETTMNKSGPSSMTSYDFCKEFDDVLSLGTSFSAGSTSNKEDSSSTGSDVECVEKFDDIQSNSCFGCTSDLNPSMAEINEASSGPRSEKESSMAEIQNFSGLFQKLQSPFSIPRWRKASNLSNEYPSGVLKLREDMEIKDVVKAEAIRFLPAKSLIRFRSVSKEWDNWISSPLFPFHQSHSFHDLSGYFTQRNGWNPSFISLCKPAYGVPSPTLSFLPEQTSIKSSCNGLLLCQGCGLNKTYYVCNPVTKEWRRIPEPGCYHGENSGIILAFEPTPRNIRPNYHLICAAPMLDQPFILFEIFSSETNSWKCSETLFVGKPNEFLKGSGVFSNGIAFWETSCDKVLAFDLMAETTDIVCSLPEGAWGGVLAHMRGDLCYVCAPNRNGSVFAIDIYGGMGMNLKQSVSFDLGKGCCGDVRCRVLSCVKDDTVIILVEGYIYSCCLKEKKVVMKCGRWFDACDQYFPYVNSLVSLA